MYHLGPRRELRPGVPNGVGLEIQLAAIGGAVLLILYLAFWAWHSTWAHKLTKAEIDHYMAIIENLPMPPEKVTSIASRLRRWAAADDGKPFYMFNLIHLFPQLRTFPGAPEFKGTPRESNAYYMKRLMWLWLSHAAYPLLSTRTFMSGFRTRPIILWLPRSRRKT